MKVSKRDRTLLIVCVIGLAILVWGLLNPPAKTTSAAKLLPLKEAQHKTEIARRTTNRLIGEQADNAPRIRKMAYDLPVEQLEPRIIQNLQEIATRAGVHLKEVKPLHPHPLNSGGQSVPLEVRFEAAFQPNVIRFLYFVEDPKGKMVVDKMNVTSTDPRFRAVDVTAQISVFTRAAAAVAATPQGETKSVNTKTADI